MTRVALILVDHAGDPQHEIVLQYTAKDDLVRRTGPGDGTNAPLSLLFHDLVAAVRHYAIEVERLEREKATAKESAGA